STFSASWKIAWTSRVRSGSSSAVTMRAPLGAPLESQAEPTPQPVPSSARVPCRDAAKVARSRPVSLRVEVMNPRRRDRSKARATRSGTSAGALMGLSVPRPDRAGGATHPPEAFGVSLLLVYARRHAEAARTHRLPRQDLIGPTPAAEFRRWLDDSAADVLDHDLVLLL